MSHWLLLEHAIPFFAIFWITNIRYTTKSMTCNEPSGPYATTISTRPFILRCSLHCIMRLFLLDQRSFVLNVT